MCWAVTRSDAIDYANDRVRVNAVLPGILDTPMTNQTPELRAFLLVNPVQRTPYKRFGLPEEIADVVVYLAGNKTSLVSGASWLVDSALSVGYN